MDDQPQKKSYKLVWIAGASLAVFLVILGGTFYLVSQTTKNDKTASTTTKTTSTSTKLATKADVQKGLDNIKASLAKATTDRAAVKVAIDSKPVKVGK
jgi:hypothetical protein